MKTIVDFGKRHKHGKWAKYLPAISGFYTTHLGKDLSNPDFVPAERVQRPPPHLIKAAHLGLILVLCSQLL